MPRNLVDLRGPEPHSPAPYVHGYGDAEERRLGDQAASLEALIHGALPFLRAAGCWRSAAASARRRWRSPGAAGRMHHGNRHFHDISGGGRAARCPSRAASRGIHPRRRAGPALSSVELRPRLRLLRSRAPERAREGRAAFASPPSSRRIADSDRRRPRLVATSSESRAAHAAIACQVELQRRAGGNACLGRCLQPLLAAAGFDCVRVEPRVAYADATRPDWADGFTARTFTAMVAAVRADAIAAGLTDAPEFDAGIAALRLAAAPDGTFSYTFFKATARRFHDICREQL